MIRRWSKVVTVSKYLAGTNFLYSFVAFNQNEFSWIQQN